MSKSVPITHKVFLIAGFIVSGYLYFFPVDDIPDGVKCFGGVQIPDDQLIDVYQRLELPTDVEPRG